MITGSVELTAGGCVVYTSSGTTVGSLGTLTVDAGVTVQFSGGLDVQGTLTVRGTADQPVAFTSASTNPAPGNWPGLRYEAGSSGGISYVTVNYAGGDGGWVSGGNYSAVSFYGRSNVRVDHVTVENSGRTGLSTTAGATPSVANSTFINNAYVGVELGDPDALMGLSNNTFIGNRVVDGNGVYLDGGRLTQQVTVSPADDGSLRLAGNVQVGSTGGLTVTAGTAILGNGGLDVLGSLTAIGTAAQPVLFTSAAASPAPGDWPGVRYEAGSTGSMTFTTVNYAGGTGCWYVCGSTGGITFNGRVAVALDHVTVQKSSTDGLRATSGAAPSVTDSTFSNNGVVGIQLDGPDALVGLAHNTFTSNRTIDGNGVFLDGGVLTGQATLSTVDDGVVRLGGNVQIGSTGALVVTPGTTVLGNGGLDVLGALTVQGTASQPVTFTSAAASPAPGDWPGVRYEANSTGEMSYATVDDAGGTGCWYVCGSTGGITFNGRSSANIDHVTIQNSGSDGLRTTSGATPGITNSKFINNAWVGIELGDLDALTGLADNTFTSNRNVDGNGIYLDGGTLTRQATLSTAADGTIRLAGNVQVGSTAALTVTSGTTVLGNGGLDVLGSLAVQGTAAHPVIFTSASANPAPGDWPGVRYESGSMGSMTYAMVDYAGWNGCWAVCGSYAGVSLNGPSAVSFDHLTVQNSTLDGLSTSNGAMPIVSNSTFSRDRLGVHLGDPDALAGFSNNTFTGNRPIDGDGILLDGGTLTKQVSLSPADDGRVRLAGNVSVGSTGSLTVLPGTTVLGNGGLDVQGALTVDGTASRPVLFTSASANPQPGDWPGVRYEAGAVGSMSYAIVDYAGWNGCWIVCGSYAAVSFNGFSIVSIDHLTARKSGLDGLSTSNGAAPVVTSSIFADDRLGVHRGDPDALVGFSNNTFSGNRAIDGDGILLDGGTLTRQVTLSTADDGRVRLAGNVVVGSTGSLTVTAGTTVLGNGGLDVQGALTVEGNAMQPVVFTSASGNPAPGDWPGVRYEAGSTGSLSYTTIAYAGWNGCWAVCGSYANISFNGRSKITIDHLTSKNGGLDGLSTSNGATPVVANSAFTDDRLGVHLGDPDALAGFSSNTFTGNRPVDGDGILLDGGTLTKQITLSSGDDGRVRLAGNVVVGSTGSLTVMAGTTVLGNGGLDVQGQLNVQGTASQPVLFTSASASPQPGDWPGVRYEAGSIGSLSYTIVKYGGWNGCWVVCGSYANVSFNGPSAVTVDHLTSENGGLDGLSTSNGAAPVVTNSTFADNRLGVHLGDPDALAGFSGNTFTGNRPVDGDGIYLDGGTLTKQIVLSTANDGQVRLAGNVVVASKASLVVGGGMTVLGNGGLDVQGTLTVQGVQTQPVLFTSASASPQPGDWPGVRYEAGSAGSMSYTTVEYAGWNGCWVVCGSYANVSFSGLSTIRIDHLTSQRGGLDGLSTSNGAMPIVSNSTFTSNRLGVHLGDPDALAGFSTNTFTGNRPVDGDGIYLDGGTLTKQVTLSPSDDGRVRLAGNVSVGSTGSLTVLPGTMVLGNGGLDVLGALTVEGTASQPVLFTSASASPAPGDWPGVRYEAGSVGSMSYATVEDAGWNGCWIVCGSYAAVSFNGFSIVSIDHLTARKSGLDGLSTSNGAAPVVTNSTFTGNRLGIHLGDPTHWPASATTPSRATGPSTATASTSMGAR